jgi:hypothetical protein
MISVKHNMQQRGNSPLKKDQKNPYCKPSRNKALMIKRNDKYLDNFFYYTEIFKDLK